MPLVENTGLPAFARLRASGVEVLSRQRAGAQDIRELHIGLLNLMPDAALEATERQFFRLVGSCNSIAQFYIHPFTVPGVVRGTGARRHLTDFYEDFADVQRQGLDALIISGANPASAAISREPFWEQLLEVIDWADRAVCSTFYSCFATHAAIWHKHGQQRQKLPQKRWGVYSHRVCDSGHPLTGTINSRFDAPHSHVYDTSCQQARAAGWRVLVQGEEVGLYLAVSADGFRHIYCQGHPEYDTSSLLKEHKRELYRYAVGEREQPPLPENYYPPRARTIVTRHREQIDQAIAAGRPSPVFPEAEILPLLENTWSDTGRAVFNNWLGIVYQITHHDRKIPFMEGVDPGDPLGMKEGRAAERFR